MCVRSCCTGSVKCPKMRREIQVCLRNDYEKKNNDYDAFSYVSCNRRRVPTVCIAWGARCVSMSHGKQLRQSQCTSSRPAKVIYKTIYSIARSGGTRRSERATRGDVWRSSSRRSFYVGRVQSVCIASFILPLFSLSEWAGRAVPRKTQFGSNFVAAIGT